jgi:hypothetical protein
VSRPRTRSGRLLPSPFAARGRASGFAGGHRLPGEREGGDSDYQSQDEDGAVSETIDHETTELRVEPAQGQPAKSRSAFRYARYPCSSHGAAAFSAFNRNMVILLMPVFGIVMAASLTPIAALGVIQAPEDEPGSLPGIANAAFGIGGSLGFAWAGTIVAQGTKAGFQSALWICVAIGVAALATSMILKPRPLVKAPDSTPQVTH